jgi:aldose 1-epimerase
MQNAVRRMFSPAGFLGMVFLAAGVSVGADGIQKTDFGKLPAGQTVDLYTLTNASGMQVSIMNYGAIIVSLKVPDRQGKVSDVVLGFDSLKPYLQKHPYFGAVVGRYGNRICQGKFTLDGKQYTLAQNDNGQHLHGGLVGFDKVLWKVKAATGGAEPSLALQYVSKDGEEGYPGNLDTTITYTLTKDNSLKIDYLATTDKPTVLNLTSHSYFNLAGAGEGDVLNTKVTINADRFTPVDKGLIPTGKLQAVAGTPFDFTKSTAIGERINADHEQVKCGGGYDHNWVLNKKDNELSLAAKVVEPTSGRVMEVLTTEPAMQFYTGNFLDGSNVGREGKAYPKRGAFCMETQHYPDSPNEKDFPSTVLRPGDKYQTTTIYRFSVAK